MESIQEAEFTSKGDILRFLDQVIATTFTFLTSKASFLQFEAGYSFQKLMGNPMLFRDIMDQDRFLHPDAYLR